MTQLTAIAPTRRPFPIRSTLNHPGLRLVVLLAAVIAAYHYTLASLLRGLSVDSPLAYLGLVPVLSLATGLACARPGLDEPEIHDRHLDWIIGTPLILAALSANLLLPAQFSTMYWVWRVDILTLPFFVAGAVTLLFGARMLFRVRWAVLMLFLAWPVPLRNALALGLDGFTGVTIMTLRSIAAPLGLATSNATDAALFTISGPQGPFQVVLASACSGANSLLGFLVVAPCMILFVHGRRARRIAWLLSGLLLAWAGNIVRLVLILWVGRTWGEDVAINVVHPYAGTAIFAICIVVLMVLTIPFGLEIRPPSNGRRSLRTSLDRAVKKWIGAGVVVCVVAAALVTLNTRLAAMSPIAGTFGQALLAAFNPATVAIEGFEGRAVDRFPFARQFFGDDADWTRYEFSGDGTAELASPVPVIADVVTVSDRQSFEDFDIQSCYSFHGYTATEPEEFDLGAGVVGRLITWRDSRTAQIWTTLYWYWPIAAEDEKPRYQRIALLMTHDPDARYATPLQGADPQGTAGIKIHELMQSPKKGLGRTDPGDNPEAIGDAAGPERAFVVAFGRRVVADVTSRTSAGA